MKNLAKILVSLNLVMDLLDEDIKTIEQKDGKDLYIHSKKLLTLLTLKISLASLTMNFEKLK